MCGRYHQGRPWALKSGKSEWSRWSILGILDNHSPKIPPNWFFLPLNFGAAQKKLWCKCTGCTG